MNDNQRPRIRVFYEAKLLKDAEQVGSGIEEEGLPYLLEAVKHPETTALQDIAAAGLGVAVSAARGRCCIFYGQLKENRPFMIYDTSSRDSLKRAGINAARIVKNRPLAF